MAITIHIALERIFYGSYSLKIVLKRNFSRNIECCRLYLIKSRIISSGIFYVGKTERCHIRLLFFCRAGIIRNFSSRQNICQRVKLFRRINIQL